MTSKYANVVLLMAIFIVSRLFISRESGEVNSAWVLIEDIGFFILITSNYKKLLKVKMNVVLAFFLIYYFLSFILISDLSSYITIVHLVFRGVAFCMIGYLLYVDFKDSFDRHGAFASELLFYGLSASNIVESIRFTSFEYVADQGSGGSFIAFLGLVCIMQLLYVERSHKLQTLYVLARVAIIFFLVIKLNSLTSIIAFSTACLVACALYKKFKFILLSLLVSIPVGSSLYDDLMNGDIRIARKDLTTIQEGTGRFETWSACSSMIAAGEVPLIGVGLMNEAKLLGELDLQVVHTCHSSPLSNVFSFGVIGALLYLAFSLVCLRELVFCARFQSDRTFIYSIFIMGLYIFGISSSFGPGMPSVLVSFFVWFGFGSRENFKEKNINHGI